MNLPQDHIVEKYKEKHPKLLATEPKDWDTGRAFDVGFASFVQPEKRRWM